MAKKNKSVNPVSDDSEIPGGVTDMLKDVNGYEQKKPEEPVDNTTDTPGLEQTVPDPENTGMFSSNDAGMKKNLSLNENSFNGPQGFRPKNVTAIPQRNELVPSNKAGGPVASNISSILNDWKSTMVDDTQKKDAENPIGNSNKTYDNFNIPGSTGGRPLSMDGLTNADWNPSQSESPVTMNTLSGRYFGSLPVFMGGQLLYPFNVRNARIKAVNDYLDAQNKKKDNAKDAVWAMLKEKEGKPAYEDQLHSFYQKHILGGVNDIMDQYGDKAFDKLNDPEDPDTQKIFGDYNKYSSLITASKQMDDAYKDIQSQITAGRVLSPGTKKLYDAYSSGDIDAEYLPYLPAQMQTYLSLDGYLDNIKDMIGKDVSDFYKSGMTADGKNYSSLNGTALFTKVSKDYWTPERKAQIADRVKQAVSAGIIPEGVYNDAFIQSYIDAMAPNQIQQTLEQIHSPTNVNVSIGNKNEKGEDIVLNENGALDLSSTPLGKGFDKIPYNNGYTFKQNQQIQLNGTSASTYGGIPGKPIHDVFLRGIYDFPTTDTKGVQQIDPNSKDRNTWAMVSEWVDEPNPNVANDASHPTIQVEHQYAVPYTQEIQQAVDVLKTNQDQTQNPNYVAKKDTDSSQKGGTVPGIDQTNRTVSLAQYMSGHDFPKGTTSDDVKKYFLDQGWIVNP